MEDKARSKYQAILLSFLMATISMSATMQSWDEFTLEPEVTIQTVSSNATVNLTAGHKALILTSLTGNTSSGSYDIHSNVEGMYFTPDEINADGKVSVGNSMCLILLDTSLKCWGYNYYGQLGIGSTTTQTTPQTVDLGTGRTAVSVSLGQYHTCAVLDDGSLRCWGWNNYGQLGIGSTTQQTTPQTVDLGTGRTAVSVSLGTSHTCAVLDDGTLKCWGYNVFGQLGLGSTTNQNTPQTVTLGTGRTAVSVSLGQYHTCAVLDDGSLKCWGQNSQGQLGIGSTTSQTTPQTVDLGTGRTAVSVSLGYGHTCAVLDDGSLKCWGQNYYGQLGIGSTTQQTTPQTVDLGTGRTAVSVSLGGAHTCAVLDDGTLKCWGHNSQSQLGHRFNNTTNYATNR